jgi:VTC domain-containing protein
MRADAAAVPFDVSGFATVGLAEVVEDAARLTRVDRKYLVGRDVAEDFLGGLPDTFRLLDVDGRSATTYSSIYFDTVDLDACRDHVQRRRRRWKVRSRVYVEDRLCRIEVKTKDGRGVTVKSVADSCATRHGLLDGAEREFVADTLAGLGLPVDAASLAPSMSVDYRRVTLADTRQGLRVTLDWGVECVLADGRVRLDDDFVLVETKGVSRPSDADRSLVALGARPRPFSKYASAVALLRDDIPDNDVRRLRGRELHAMQGPGAVMPA